MNKDFSNQQSSIFNLQSKPSFEIQYSLFDIKYSNATIL